MANTMRVVEYDRYGAADVCQLRERPIPVPSARQVLVRVRAAALNPKDVLLRAGKFPLLAGIGFPKRLGYDFAGELAAVGARVSGLKVGDAVFGMLQWSAGSCADYCLASPSELWRKPPALSFEEAAALPLTSLTALQALRDEAQLVPGQRVLINGASGGVGVCATQLAKVLGAHVTTISSARNRELLQQLGSDAWYDYQGNEAPTGPFDVYFDVFGNQSLGRVKPLLTERATFVSTVPKAGVIRDQLLTAMSHRRARLVVVRSRSQDLALVAQHVETGQLRAVLHEVYPFEGIVAALQQVESKHTQGKVVLRS